MNFQTYYQNQDHPLMQRLAKLIVFDGQLRNAFYESSDPKEQGAITNKRLRVNRIIRTIKNIAK